MLAQIFTADTLRDPDTSPLTYATTFEIRHFHTDVAALEFLFAALNAHPDDLDGQEIMEAWYGDGNRSLSVGDIVVLVRDLAPGEKPLRLAYKCASSGWTRWSDPRTSESHPEAPTVHSAPRYR